MRVPSKGVGQRPGQDKPRGGEKSTEEAGRQGGEEAREGKGTGWCRGIGRGRLDNG